MEQSTRTRLLTAVLLFVVFGSGVLVGFAADTSLGAEQPAAPTDAAERPTGEASEEAPEEAPEEAVARADSTESRYLYQQVGANEAQLARIEVVVNDYRARREALTEQMMGSLQEQRRELRQATLEAIKAEMTPEQALEYQRLVDEADARRAAAEGSGGNGN